MFQNPYGSLNPRKRIGQILEAPLEINTNLTAEQRAEALAQAQQAAAQVEPAKAEAARYRKALEEGNRQRNELRKFLERT